MIDLRRGLAVHARGGVRARYRPVESVLTPGRPGDALALAAAYRDTLHAAACYVADLDAIETGALQRTALAALADPARGFGPGLMVDAGTADPEGARMVLDAGATQAVVGLETLRRLDGLGLVVETIGPAAAVFSLDLRQGVPVLHPDVERGAMARPDAATVLMDAVAAGIRTVIVLDLARVGSAAGPDLGLLDRLRQRAPQIRLIAGGGVRGPRDVEQLAALGLDAVLVASAVHAGRL
ncbi:MAG: HisA/HisF-related TIM barrel protein [Gemmatimonadota bacterium]